jgi:hypothetical protein
MGIPATKSLHLPLICVVVLAEFHNQPLHFAPWDVVCGMERAVKLPVRVHMGIMRGSIQLT